MIDAIISFSLRFRGVVVALACLLAGYGLYVTSRAKLDVFPNFVQPQVVIQTEAPGLAPEQVEALVTRPVETAVNGLGKMESLRSESIQGLSVVTAVFEEGTDVFLARQQLAPTKIHTTASVHLEQVPGGFSIPRIELRTRASIPGIDAAKFAALAADAKQNCPVSKALAGVEISLDAALE